MGQLWKKPREVRFLLCTFSGAVRAVWRLCGPTSNLQGNSGSGGSGWAAGHTAVLAAVDLLHPANVQGSVVNVLLHEGSRANLQLTWGHVNKIDCKTSCSTRRRSLCMSMKVLSHQGHLRVERLS